MCGGRHLRPRHFGPNYQRDRVVQGSDLNVAEHMQLP
jgi:hypothetical protein